MDLNQYQERARATSKIPGSPEDLTVPLLGIAGEVGSLLVEYKKKLRDGSAHRLFREQLAEELGDILWYTAELATRLDLKLDEIAEANIQKTRLRWLPTAATYSLFDAEYPGTEQLPRRFIAEIRETSATPPRITLSIDGVQVGNELEDNAYEDDGYRFHDVMHLGHATLLGWSPNVRGFLKRKRKSDRQIDSIEDGGRAGVIEEGIVAFVFAYARERDFLENVDALDYSVLRTIQQLTDGLEVGQRSAGQWEEAILRSYEVWRQVRANRGGRIECDLEARTFTFTPDAPRAS